MSIIPKITSALKTAGGKPLSVASKVLGVATCAAVIYDSHINGRERAYVVDEKETGDRFMNQYSQYMTSEKESAVVCKMKKLWYELQQSFPFYHVTSRTKGYTGGFCKTLIKSLPLIGLSAVALLSKGKIPGKIAGAALAVNAVKTFLYDVAGVGASKQTRKY